MEPLKAPPTAALKERKTTRYSVKDFDKAAYKREKIAVTSKIQVFPS